MADGGFYLFSQSFIINFKTFILWATQMSQAEDRNSVEKEVFAGLIFLQVPEV